MPVELGEGGREARPGVRRRHLDGIVGLSVAGKQRMLPIWHEISKDEVEQQSPSLADKIARTTATSTIAEIADEIASVVRDSIAA